MITSTGYRRALRSSYIAIALSVVLAHPIAAAPRHKKALALYAPRPQLPEIARKKHLRGDGEFMFHIRPDGSVSRVSVLRSTGHEVLDNATIAALSKWRFEPGTRSEVRVPFSYTGNYDGR